MEDILTKEECQAIIDQDHDWKSVDVTKKLGGVLKFQSSEVDVWKDQYPSILHELVLKYEIDDFCSEHIDSPWNMIHPNYHAHAVWITPLNDDYEGGELYFDGKLIKQEVGVPVKYLRTIPHEITKITKGTRYSLVAWLFKRHSAKIGISES